LFGIFLCLRPGQRGLNLYPLLVVALIARFTRLIG
jgi:hypothetical protein